MLILPFGKQESSQIQPAIWHIQSIDTMKYSRDSSGNPAIFMKIPFFIKTIANLGASYVAIDTPYDEEFYPYLSAWVNEARKNNLKVWFRGNFSAWEGWFNHSQIQNPGDDHAMIKNFILRHPELFQTNDIFTPVPEPENGGMGDPRGSDEKTRQYNQFLIDSYNNCVQSFRQIHINVSCGYFSMNGDIAKYVLEKDTVKKIGNVVVIDHYVDSPEKMAEDLDFLRKKFDTVRIVLGEFGAPIPDINGSMTENEQAAFVDSLMKIFYSKRNTIAGMNYWVISGGSTALLNDDGTSRAVTDVIKKYYIPNVWQGTVVNTLGERISDDYIITTPENSFTATIRKDTYKEKVIKIEFNSHKTIMQTVVLEPKNPSLIYKIRLFLKNLLHL